MNGEKEWKIKTNKVRNESNLIFKQVSVNKE